MGKREKDRTRESQREREARHYALLAAHIVELLGGQIKRWLSVKI